MLKLSVFRVFLLTTSCICLKINVAEEENSPLGYDPQAILARIFNYANSTEYRQAGYGFSTFENAQNLPNNAQGYGFANFEGQPPETDNQNHNNNLVSFQDQNSVHEFSEKPPTWPHQKRKRRRRKPRLQQLPGSGYGLQHPIVNNLQNPQIVQSSYGYPQYVNGQFNRPPYQSRPSSLAEDALTRITTALESVARYDDYQCVPRLLCEAAGGRASTQSTSTSDNTQSTLLTSFMNVQPLIMLLGAYSGVSSSPLFVFGRAVFLGATSKDNNGICRYAYPQCPTDPEKLVDYLNNYNGGFFRFFSAPPTVFPSEFNGQASLQQFYSQLLNIPQQNQLFLNQQQRPGDSGGQYGIHQTDIGTPISGLYNNQFQSGYGYPQNYGFNYPYNSDKEFRYIEHQKHKMNKDRQKKKKIEKRIQNNPSVSFTDSDQGNRGKNLKWTFPESMSRDNDVSEDNSRTGRVLKFPEDTATAYRPIVSEENLNSKPFIFPGQQSNRHYTENHNYEQISNFNDLPSNIVDDIKYDESGYYVESSDFVDSNDFVVNSNHLGGDVKVVYVVRGNGDPNKPEVVRLMPGQNVV